MKKVLGILGALVAIAATATVYALPANEVEVIYYSDASMTDEVGYRYTACQGGVYRSGRLTRYAVSFSTPCHSGGGAEVACFLNGRETTCPSNICESYLVTCS
jgi:hypothetical protein